MGFFWGNLGFFLGNLGFFWVFFGVDFGLFLGLVWGLFGQAKKGFFGHAKRPKKTQNFGVFGRSAAFTCAVKDVLETRVMPEITQLRLPQAHGR